MAFYYVKSGQEDALSLAVQKSSLTLHMQTQINVKKMLMHTNVRVADKCTFIWMDKQKNRQVCTLIGHSHDERWSDEGTHNSG